MKLCLIKARAIYEPGGYGGADGLLGFGRRFAVALDQFDETAAGGGDEFDAAAVFGRRAAEKFAVETPLGGQHPDHPAAGIQAGGFHGRLHAHDRHRDVFLPQEVDCGGRGGIAGHDDHLAPLRDEAGDGLVGEPPHLLAGARSVGAVFAVAQIDERFGGQHAPHLAPDGQSAQPRIVNTYGSIVHSLLCICHSVRFGGKQPPRREAIRSASCVEGSFRPPRRRTARRNRRSAAPARKTVRAQPSRGS